jgi:glycine hydroxymethyltransferase
VHLFLNTLTANDVSLLDVGQAHYTFLLDPEGHVIDDAYLYRLAKERYWLMVNAANTDKDWAWINSVHQGQVLIDVERPWSRALGTETVRVRNLGQERIALALQGPRSRDILLSMLEPDDKQREALQEMKRNQIQHMRLAGYDLYLSRTGYTGEPVAFEIFVHPAAAPALWHALMEAGEPLGLKAAGLGARDSLRIEAGLPLYGHELAGPLDLNPADGGFAPYVKLYKPFFIGKAAYARHERKRQARVARFRIEEERARPPHQGDVVVNRKGRVVGAVTSASIDTEGRLVGLAYLQTGYSERGTRLGIFQVDSRSWADKPLTELKTGDRVQLHDDIIIIRRFLNKKE